MVFDIYTILWKLSDKQSGAKDNEGMASIALGCSLIVLIVNLMQFCCRIDGKSLGDAMGWTNREGALFATGLIVGSVIVMKALLKLRPELKTKAGIESRFIAIPQRRRRTIYVCLVINPIVLFAFRLILG
jgi:hypothetical protein